MSENENIAEGVGHGVYHLLKDRLEGPGTPDVPRDTIIQISGDVEQIVLDAAPFFAGSGSQVHFTEAFKAYIQATADLPLPTNAQCVAFAEHLEKDYHEKGRYVSGKAPSIFGYVMALEPFVAHDLVGSKLVPVTGPDSNRGLEFTTEEYTRRFGHLSHSDMAEKRDDKLGLVPSDCFVFVDNDGTTDFNSEANRIAFPPELSALAKAVPRYNTGYQDRAELWAEQIFAVRDLIRQGREQFVPGYEQTRTSHLGSDESAEE